MKVGLSTLQLYDKLESNFRPLESVGMTADKYAVLLFPLVESCIPEEHVKSLHTGIHLAILLERNILDTWRKTVLMKNDIKMQDMQET
jgi:hypothetical protein